jgi:hypothetical protein
MGWYRAGPEQQVADCRAPGDEEAGREWAEAQMQKN